jgi:6,7-dimethyl-8-ribityllumazine synthase
MSRFRLAIVVSRYNRTITDALLSGALATVRARVGGDPPAAVFDAAGSFEILAISRAAAVSGRFDGIVALGCIIKGETSHDQHLAASVTSGLANLTLHTGVPVGLGVLTVDTIEQARARAGLTTKRAGRGATGEQLGNKGAEAADALIDTLVTMRTISAVSAPGLGGARRRASKRSAEGNGVPSAVASHGDSRERLSAVLREGGSTMTDVGMRRSPVPDKAAKSDAAATSARNKSRR